ncbi:hypothetical protein [Nocardiopsis sp. NRRL B-16309]|uniref:hypothetical protein n=1 Tax=Nocardiopsis sp. NRRL B-16309 TaxID=1519494 RepID=UPI000AD0C79B
MISEAAVAKNISGIFTKLDLPVAPGDNRRVLAVLAPTWGGDPAGRTLRRAR